MKNAGDVVPSDKEGRVRGRGTALWQAGSGTRTARAGAVSAVHAQQR
ncbi:hypothetical protein HF329_19735 [Chitinophaga oryzae]|uniref:Uncharacterized protein n=1 Tax=Chitinophaga oryzae TaxID=2725414 RepID=A0AAE6ZHU2_9BACT|nr:hypothetical protein [Chitinophaga oryzae]QJB33429.1 hypothetical protein HF329_19735 [Chitinophaga oryzae]